MTGGTVLPAGRGGLPPPETLLGGCGRVENRERNKRGATGLSLEPDLALSWEKIMETWGCPGRDLGGRQSSLKCWHRASG